MFWYPAALKLRDHLFPFTTVQSRTHPPSKANICPLLSSARDQLMADHLSTSGYHGSFGLERGPVPPPNHCLLPSFRPVVLDLLNAAAH